MQAGRLRHRVSIAALQETDDEHHGYASVPLEIASRIPAEVVELSGRALDRAQQIDPRIICEVHVRFRADIASGQQLTYHDPDRGDRVFEIVGPPVNPEGRRRELVLTVKAAL